MGLLERVARLSRTHAGAERLAEEACRIEIDVCRKPIGKQDQYIAAYGGFQCIRFDPDGKSSSIPSSASRRRRRNSSDACCCFTPALPARQIRFWRNRTQNTAGNAATRAALRKMSQMAQAMCGALCANGLDNFGEMLHESWLLKKSLASTISNPNIDEWYERARKHGAIGGKILGAGGGGFLLLYAHPERHPAIISALASLSPTPFRFEPQGSKIIYVEESV